MKFSLIILCVVDCYKIDWHDINIKFIPTGNALYRYFQIYYGNIQNIYINKNGRDHNLKNVKKIEEFIEDEPNRACIYLYTKL